MLSKEFTRGQQREKRVRNIGDPINIEVFLKGGGRPDDPDDSNYLSDQQIGKEDWKLRDELAVQENYQQYCHEGQRGPAEKVPKPARGTHLCQTKLAALVSTNQIFLSRGQQRTNSLEAHYAIVVEGSGGIGTGMPGPEKLCCTPITDKTIANTNTCITLFMNFLPLIFLG
jgi:hypothetical protein